MPHGRLALLVCLLGAGFLFACDDAGWLRGATVAWQVEDPEEHGFSRAAFDDLRDRLESGGTNALLIGHRDAIVYEWYGPDMSAAKQDSCASVAKALFGGLSLVIAMDEGAIHLDEPAWHRIPAWASDPERSRITVRQLVTHSSGISNNDPSADWAERFWRRKENPFDIALYEAPLEAKPGERFVYSSPAFGALGYAIANGLRARGVEEDIKQLLESRIMAPLGIPDAAWTMGYGLSFELDGLTLYPNWGGCRMTARALARVGELMRNRGRWSNQRILDPLLVELAISDLGQPKNDTIPARGLGWWSNWNGAWPSLPEDAFAAVGAGDRVLLVVPSLELVLVRLGASLPSSSAGTSRWNHLDEILFSPVVNALDLQRREVPRPAPDSDEVALAATSPKPHQIVVSPNNRAWLFRGNGEPFFLAGAGDPEDFLYRGTLNADGTRDGDQRVLIDKLKGTGANSIYLQAVRSHGGDGHPSHNPFIDGDPASGVNQKVLDQWEGWFSEMDANDIAIYFIFYDDGSNVWPTGDRVETEERLFLNAIVKRFEHHGNLIWVIAEEYQEALTPRRVSRIAEVIRRADDFDHPIAVHKLPGLAFDEFARDPNIEQFAIQSNQSDSEVLHRHAVTAWHNAAGRYNNILAENPDWGTGVEARKRAWSIAMGGAYVMAFGMTIADTPIDDLLDLGALSRFMTTAGFHRMAPHDELAREGSKYVLAQPRQSYIVYGEVDATEIGLREMAAGEHAFEWFDIASRQVVRRDKVFVEDGEGSWPVPPGIDGEFAVHIDRISER